MHDLYWEEKLAPLVQQDHEMKNLLIEKGIISDSYHPEMEKLHLKNSRKLLKMIETMGFPVLSNAGEYGVRYSWLIIYHSISFPSFMKDCLLQMRLAAAQNDYPLDLLAYMEDRVAFLEGRAQLYGTNTEWFEGDVRSTEIEDTTRLDLRRKSMGLPPQNQTVHSGQFEKPPKDPEKRTKEFREWLVRVGWRNS